MKIGDKVRLLRGTEEGIVTKMMGNSLVEVEIEDGFSIPVLASELVVVSADEHTAFQDGAKIERRPAKKSTGKQVPEAALLKGYHLAIIPLNDELASLYFVNPNASDLLLLANEGNNRDEEKSILSEKVFAKQATKITERNMNHLNTWNPLFLTILQENNQWSIPSVPLKIRVKIKAKNFQKEKTDIPILNKKGYLIPLEQQGTESIRPAKVDADQLKESLFDSREESKPMDQRMPVNRLPSEVDLHIEEITANHQELPKDEILSIQLHTFEKKLDQAIAAGLNEIVFIHGVGNGTLRNMIHKKLSQLDNIQFFKDTHKEKFGYGATLVKIK